MAGTLRSRAALRRSRLMLSAPRQNADAALAAFCKLDLFSHSRDDDSTDLPCSENCSFQPQPGASADDHNDRYCCSMLWSDFVQEAMAQGRSNVIVFSWLCPECATKYTLAFSLHSGVELRSKAKHAPSMLRRTRNFPLALERYRRDQVEGRNSYE